MKVALSCPTLQLPGQNTGVGSLSLLQGIFPTQGSNPGLLHCRSILNQLNHKGSPRILEWVAYTFSSRSSWTRKQTRVSCIAGGFFTNWTIRDALEKYKNLSSCYEGLPGTFGKGDPFMASLWPCSWVQQIRLLCDPVVSIRSRQHFSGSCYR